MIEQLAKQYFADLESDGRQDTDDNLRAWLWFTCPANLREPVAAKIESLRTNMEKEKNK